MTGGEATITEALERLWRAKIFILGGAVLGLLAAVLFVRLAVPHYKAEIIVAPANPMNGAEISSLLADDNLFALRYMMQRVGPGNSPDFLRFENTVRGATVAAALLKREDIRRGLEADRSFAFLSPMQNWNEAKFSAYLEKRIKLYPVGATSLRRVVYFHPDPEFAAHLLSVLHEEADKIIRNTIREEAEKRVVYLKNAINATNNPEHRRALTALLLEQERLRMLVSIETPYAAAVIEPASSSFKPEWPDRALVIVIFVLMGGLLSALVFAARDAEID